MEELERRQDKGMAVDEFAEALNDQVDRALFDELAQLCLARACVSLGSHVIADDCGAPQGGMPLPRAADSEPRDLHDGGGLREGKGARDSSAYPVRWL
mmetsp:Transcript_16972/g.53116  ORF Transcript_16972/g.53116 Transcript_16972/m.53116 type:complete len:98 (-) Transcript_16972:123-416(-)